MKEKLSLLTELIKLVNCDNNQKKEEYQFLLMVAEQPGVPKNDFDSLFDEYIEFTPPKLEFDRILQFQRLTLYINTRNIRRISYIVKYFIDVTHIFTII